MRLASDQKPGESANVIKMHVPNVQNRCPPAHLLDPKGFGAAVDTEAQLWLNREEFGYIFIVQKIGR